MLGCFAMRYFYFESQTNEKKGPFDLGELRVLYRSGQVDKHIWVAPEDNPEQWVKLSSLMAGASSAPEPVVNPPSANAPVLPEKIRAIAIVSLISGIVSILIGLSWLGTGLSIFIIGIIFTIVPGAYCTAVGVLNVIYALQLMSSQPHTLRPAKYLAVLDIVSIIFLNFISCILGAVNLGFYRDKGVKGFFKTETPDDEKTDF
jgi:hypothetical protein